MKRGYRVIDGDGHMQEPLDIWTNYMPEAFKDRAPNVVGHSGKIVHKYGPCEIYPEGKVIVTKESEFSHMEDRYGDAYRSWWSMPDRLKDMDAEGVDIRHRVPHQRPATRVGCLGKGRRPSRSHGCCLQQLGH